MLLAVNAKRKVLHLPALTELRDTTNFKDGMSTLGPKPSQTIPKVTQALSDILSTREAIIEITGEQTTICIGEVREDLQLLANNPNTIESLQRASFYQTGMDRSPKDALCPFCDTPWDLDELKVHVQKKIEHLKNFSHITRCCTNESCAFGSKGPKS